MEGAGFEITCVNKNYTGMIVRIGGVGWSLSTREAIQKLMSEQLRLNLLLGNRYLDVGVRGAGSDAYLVIEPEGYALHEIEQIPSCG